MPIVVRRIKKRTCIKLATEDTGILPHLSLCALWPIFVRRSAPADRIKFFHIAASGRQLCSAAAGVCADVLAVLVGVDEIFFARFKTEPTIRHGRASIGCSRLVGDEHDLASAGAFPPGIDLEDVDQDLVRLALLSRSLKTDLIKLVADAAAIFGPHKC